MLRTTVSYAQSIDGRIATATGESRWISSEATLELAHTLRRDNDAILVGIGTVLTDDPELTCRLPDCRSPVRVILDSNARLPRDSKIVRSLDEVRTIVAVSEDRPDAAQRARELGVETIPLPCDGKLLDLRILINTLGELGIESLFVEGGSGVITSFLLAGLVDTLIVVTAPIIIGRGTEAIGDLGVKRLTEALRPRTHDIRLIGTEVVHELVFDTDCRSKH